MGTKGLLFILFYTFLTGFTKAQIGIDKHSEALTSGYGIGLDEVDIFRLGFRMDTHTLSVDKVGRLAGYIEASVNFWNGDENMYVLAISPVFAYYFGSNWAVRPYLEAGIGFSYISNSQINERVLTSHFQFEDRMGIGVRTRRVDYNFRFMHYSNANFKTPNEGMDMLVLSVGFFLSRKEDATSSH